MATTKSKPYTFYEDPGHGWLEVPTQELRDLGIADKISGYSYISSDGKRAYLEEDCDLSVFLEAKVGADKPMHVAGDAVAIQSSWRLWYEKNVSRNDRATLRGAREIFIRLLPSYPAEAYRALQSTYQGELKL